MATLLEIKIAVANYFNKTVSDLTVNGQDMFLQAVNQVRKLAELHHDFEFSRKLVTMTVDGVTGGSLLTAVEYGTDDIVDVKSVIEIGMFDEDGNFRPTRWNTVTGALRSDISRTPIARHPTDAQATSWGGRLSQFTLSGNNIYAFPRSKVGEVQSFDIGLEVYAFANDWTGILEVTGTLTPDATGTFYADGVFNDQPFYVRPDGAYLVFWNTSLSKWILAPPGEDDGLPYWASATTVLENTYAATNGATGTATVDYNNIGEDVVPNPNSISDVWTSKGQQFLQWGTIIHLNHYWKEFVFRQEGNLPPPEKLRDEGLEALKAWDSFRFEQFRRRD